ncbi:hypothetical protein MSPP1_003186 [Malassezia sp. CBS 17886]|nr:hypothetical protein MSPP1_003186 [Malassezia sp. CBS 17886]
MYLLGSYLPDHKLVRIALTTFYGISQDTARRICARIQVHDRATVASLTEAQVTDLSAYLSSPGMIPARAASPTRASVHVGHAERATPLEGAYVPPSQRASAATDPLRSILIEGDLRREMLGNIAHHRTIGTYVGRRHANGFPVRGQRTQRNGLTARRLNRLERRQYATGTAQETRGAAALSLVDMLAPLAHVRFA